MSRLQGGGFLMIGAILVVAGVLLRWDLVDWIIDTAGLLLIVLGAVVVIIGLIKMFSGGGGGGGGSYDDF
ncbi:MAG: hypothetical protein IH956_08485 [Chloroflexi bacterium]|nr:hypothetical protein [Chloroflexota bacterium]